MQHQVTFCDHRLQRHLQHHEGDLSGVRCKENRVTGGNRETDWKNIFDFKRLNTSKKKVFTGMIETDGTAICVHDRLLKADRPVVFSISPSAKHEEKKQAGPVTQEIDKNAFVVIGPYPGNTTIMTIAASKHGEYRIDGSLPQKTYVSLKSERARYDRD